MRVSIFRYDFDSEQTVSKHASLTFVLLHLSSVTCTIYNICLYSGPGKLYKGVKAPFDSTFIISHASGVLSIKQIDIHRFQQFAFVLIQLFLSGTRADL